MSAVAAPFPIVGSGGSAGGVQALEEFFRALPADSGLAFIIFTHLSPERESQLHSVIARYTDLPVDVACDGAAVQPERVYVLPSDAILTIENGILRITKPNKSRRERNPIDIFLAPLAKDRGEHAAGVRTEEHTSEPQALTP